MCEKMQIFKMLSVVINTVVIKLWIVKDFEYDAETSRQWTSLSKTRILSHTAKSSVYQIQQLKTSRMTKQLSTQLSV